MSGIFTGIHHAAVISPSGPADPELLASGAAALEAHGVKVSIMPNVGKRDDARPWLSASRQARLDDLHRAFNDPAVDMVICARGGFGAAQLLDGIDYALLRERDLPVLGYSDVTSLHLAMLANHAGRPWAAPMAIRLERLFSDAEAVKRLAPLFDASPSELGTLSILRGGSGLTALPVAANLTVLAAQCGTPYLPDFTGKLLILEDIGEAGYRLDRCLTQLAQNGIFRHAAGVIFGEFTECAKDEELRLLIESQLPILPGFVASGLEFGHEWPTVCIDQTRRVRVDCNALFTV
ncbi:MAG: LD-carboxypeptidase [Victivallaceae bacterium]|nr:LD-carboxypeptidase [Victivallaceae bacterium]